MTDLAKKIYTECKRCGEPVTEAEAEEMAEMERNAKGISREARSDKSTARKPKTVKISNEKRKLFLEMCDFLTKTNKNYTVLKENKLISVQIGEKTIKIDLIEGRKHKS